MQRVSDIFVQMQPLFINNVETECLYLSRLLLDYFLVFAIDVKQGAKKSIPISPLKNHSGLLQKLLRNYVLFLFQL